MKRIILPVLGLLLSFSNVSAQEFTDLNQPVPFHEKVKTGVLPNGITYYILHNEKPRGRASFYIYQNVGAVLENDDQDGLAHFLEHMAFNGTHTFPGNSMLDMLERYGVKFGKDINAYTTQDETVYNISRVPTDNAGLIDSCLFILRDWCDNLALTEEEIDAERGVISEEWRTRYNAAYRTRETLGPVTYNNTVYAYRDVIGNLDVVHNFDYDVLRQFYHDWYRTDLQAVAIIGDIDTEAIEKKVIELFSAIPAIENPKERTEVVIPDNEEPMYAVATDKEYEKVGMYISIRHADSSDNTLQALRDNYVIQFFNALMKGRISEAAQKGNAPFLGAGIGYGGFIRNYGRFYINTTSRVGEEAQAFEAVYTLFQQVVNDGFTQSELDRLKTNMLVSAENSYKNRKKISSDAYGKSFKTAYLDKVSLTDAGFRYRFAKEIIPTITVEEVSSIATKYLSDKNRVYTITGPEKEGVEFLTQAEIEAIIAKVQQKSIPLYVDKVPENANLLSTVPEGGKIISESKVEPFDALEWNLSNGAKVVYRFANYQKQSVELQAVSYGGSSLYEGDVLPSVGAVGSFVKGFGIGAYDPITYKKIMTGKSASSGFKLGAYTESVVGKSTPEDLETMLQLVYMRFEEPRFDEEKFNNLIERSYKSLTQQVKTPQDLIKDTLRAIVSNGDPRTMEFDSAYLAAMHFETMKDIYNERFSNAADFTFFIVGNVDTATVKPLVEQYIGSIPGSEKREMWKDHGNYFPKGKNEYRIEIPMQDPKASVVLKIKNSAKYSRETVIYHSILKSILGLRFTENIREKEGGTYGVNVQTGASRIPEMKLSMDISFNCDPSKADYLKSLVYKELNEVQKHVKQSDLDKVVLNMEKSLENRHTSNSYWMGALKTWYETGENVLEPAYFDEILEYVTAKDMERAAKHFLKKADVLDIIFVPEEN